MSRRAGWFLLGVVAIAVGATAGNSEEHKNTPPKGSQAMSYVEPSEQLVVELYVRNVKESAAFYERLGFEIIRREPTFIELGWESSRLYLEELPGQPAPPTTLIANIRIMVPDVDRFWNLTRQMQLPVKRPIGDRSYGLRDFTVVSPDGIGLRFASKLDKQPAE